MQTVRDVLRPEVLLQIREEHLSEGLYEERDVGRSPLPCKAVALLGPQDEIARVIRPQGGGTQRNFALINVDVVHQQLQRLVAAAPAAAMHA